MVSMFSDGSNDNETTFGDDAQFGLRQLNLQIKGLVPGDKNAVIWGGKRYYQRHDLHIIDTKYWNISGSGAGIENYTLGPGAISFAWIRGDANDVDYRVDGDNDVNINYLDLRYAGWKPWSGAWTEFGIDYAMPNTTKSRKSMVACMMRKTALCSPVKSVRICGAAIRNWYSSTPIKAWHKT